MTSWDGGTLDEREYLIVRGTVQQIVYYNDENGYAVLRLKTEGGETVTVVGTIPVLAVGLCHEVETDVLKLLVYYIISLMSVNSPADSVLRAAFCHYPENYITLMEYYDPAEHGMAGYTRR